MIYKVKPFEVCKPGLNFHAWNNWVLIVGPCAVTFWRGHFKKYRVAP